MISFRLREILKERHLGTVELERMTNLAGSTIFNLLGGKEGSGKIQRIDLRTLDKLCDVLGVGVNDLLKRDSLLETIRSECEEVVIAVGAREQVVRGALARDYIDPWEVRSISEISSALPLIWPGKLPPIRIEVLTKDHPVPKLQELLTASKQLLVTVGSPLSNPLLLPALEVVACQEGITNARSRVRLQLQVEMKELHKESAKLCGLLLDVVPPGGPFGIQIPNPPHPPRLIESARPGKVSESGEYTDAAMILLNENPMFVGIVGCGATGTYAAAHYFRSHGINILGNVAPRLNALVFQVNVRKRTTGTVDDRELVPEKLASCAPSNVRGVFGDGD